MSVETINRIHELKEETEIRLARHGLELMLNYDTTRMYRNVPHDKAMLSASIYSNRNEVTEEDNILLTGDADIDIDIDIQINALIDNIVTYIDSSGINVINLSVDVTKRHLPDGAEPMAHLIHKLDILFGFNNPAQNSPTSKVVG